MGLGPGGDPLLCGLRAFAALDVAPRPALPLFGGGAVGVAGEGADGGVNLVVDVGLDLGREQALELLPARTVILEAGDVRPGEEQGRLRAGLPHAGHRLELLPRCGELPTHARVGGEDGGVLGAAGVEGADSEDRGEVPVAHAHTA